MKQIWAPWRMEYIKQAQNSKLKAKNSGCFLCAYNRKKDNKNFILYYGKYSFIIMNRFPYNAGHIMIAPYRHIGQIEKLNSNETTEMFRLLQQSIIIIKKIMNPDGFNVGINIGLVGGAGVPDHIHMHIIPRWLGDTNFMPIISDIKIINEELEKTFSKLKKEFDNYA